MQELPIEFDPHVFRERVAQQRSRVIRGFISTGFTIAVLAGLAIYVFGVRDGERSEVIGMLLWVLSFSAGVGILLQIGYLLWLRRLRAALRDVGEGLAMVLSSRGIEYAGGVWAWDAVARLAAAKGRAGHGYRLRVDSTDGAHIEFPLEGLSLLPGSLDSATRAYSSGRHGVDLTVVDD